MAEPKKRMVAKDGVVVDAEIAQRLGVEGGVEFEHWIDPDALAESVLNLDAEDAEIIRDEIGA